MCGLKKKKERKGKSFPMICFSYFCFPLGLKFHLKDFYLSWLEDGIVKLLFLIGRERCDLGIRIGKFKNQKLKMSTGVLKDGSSQDHLNDHIQQSHYGLRINKRPSAPPLCRSLHLFHRHLQHTGRGSWEVRTGRALLIRRRLSISGEMLNHVAPRRCHSHSSLCKEESFYS